MNNRFTLRCIIMILCSVLFFACQKSRQSTDNEITFDTIRTSAIFHLDNDSTKPSCSLKIVYIAPVKYTNDSILAHIQQELNIFFFDDEVYEKSVPKDAVAQYTDGFKENYRKEAQSFETGEHDSGIGGDNFYSIYKTIEGNVLYNKDNILSYQIVTMDYKGEDNSSTLYRNIVFNLDNGQQLNENDIFIPDYKPILSGLIVNKILAQNNVKSIDQLLPRGYWLDDLTPNDNFYVSREGITYIFNENEYSERSNGKITVFLPYTELNMVLSRKSPITHLFAE